MLRVQLEQQELAAALGIAAAAKASGEPIRSIGTLGEPQDNALYFISRGLDDALSARFSTLTGCLFLARPGQGPSRLGDGSVTVEVANPRLTMARILRFVRDHGRLTKRLSESSIPASARISQWVHVDGNVALGPEVVIEPFCFIGDDVTIGDRTVVHSGARILARTEIGPDCIIGPNAVVGYEGFGLERDENGYYQRLPHLGGVRIGAHVELGSLSTVDAGTLSPTTVGDGAKLDAHVHVAHNARIEADCILTAGAIIGGSVTLGSACWVGLNATVRDRVTVGGQCFVNMGAIVTHDLPNGAIVSHQEEKVARPAHPVPPEVILAARFRSED